MIRGVGTDVVDIERFTRIMRRSRDGFREHLFTDREIAYCERYKKSEASYAAVFAAKEAFLKALRTGLAPGMRWKDAEVIHESSGAPTMVAHGLCAELLGAGHVHVTLSHSDLSATAVVIIEDVESW